MVPYAAISDLPESVKGVLPAEAQKLFLRIVNSALTQYEGDDAKAQAVAWKGVQNAGWTKGPDGWHKVEKRRGALRLDVEAVQKLCPPCAANMRAKGLSALLLSPTDPASKALVDQLCKDASADFFKACMELSLPVVDQESVCAWLHAQCTGQHAPGTPITATEAATPPVPGAPPDTAKSLWKIRGSISKVDARKVFGWASVAVDAAGVPVVDHQGDVIPVSELEQAAYSYVHDSGDASELHGKRGVAKLIESVVLTPEKRVAMKLDGTGHTAWWVGFDISDDSVLAKAASGAYPEFSIGGSGRRVPQPDGTRKLIDLAIDEIAFVDAGAGKGVVQELWKRRAPQRKDQHMTVDEILAKLPEEERKIVLEAMAAAAAAVKVAAAKAEPETPADPMAKLAPEIRKQLEAERAESAALKERVAKMEDDQLTREYVAKAAAFPHLPGLVTADLGLVLKAADRGLPISKELGEKLTKAIASINATIAKSTLLEGKGSSAPTPTDAQGKIEGIAKALRDKDPTLTSAKAYAKALKENPELYRQHEAEKADKRA